MTEEQKDIFKMETRRIALEIIALSMEFPGMGLISITADDAGYFDATISDETTIYKYSKTAGHKADYMEIERGNKA